MGNVTGIMLCQPRLQIVGNPDVKMFEIQAFEDVDVFQPLPPDGLPSRSSRQQARLCPAGSGAAAFAHFASEGWWERQDSNLQPDRYERPALTIELRSPPSGAL